MSLKDFVILDQLGQGSYATVFKVKRLNDHKVYALKQIKMNRLDEKSKQNALNQVRFLASFNCSTIVAYHEAFIEEKQGLLCIVMEYAEGGDLMKLIKNNAKQKTNIPEIQIWKLMINLLKGTQYLHQRCILHRDIKPQNIFISNGIYKLGDLNVSKIKTEGKKLTQTGTPYYASPEVWNDLPYDEKTDVWSIGCALYQMASLRPPFISSNLQSLFYEVTRTKQKPIPKFYSNQLGSIINRCLQKDPKNRPTIAQLQQNWTVKMYQNICSDASSQDQSEKKKLQLLNTINFPTNRQIKQIQLPKSKYDQQKQVLTFREPFSPIHQSKNPNNKQNFQTVLSNPLSQIKEITPRKLQKIENNVSKMKQFVERQCSQNSRMSNNLQTPVSDKKNIRRSSPRTELSKSKKLGMKSQQNLNFQKIRPFIFGNKAQLGDYNKIIESKLCKGMKKNHMMEQLIKNQQKAYKNVIQKSKGRVQIFTKKGSVQQRVNNVLSAIRL